MMLKLSGSEGRTPLREVIALLRGAGMPDATPAKPQKSKSRPKRLAPCKVP